jgi:heme/copper-type cytochrome/quinol oxidase subunit 2
MNNSQKGAVNPVVIAIIIVILAAVAVWAFTMRNEANNALVPTSPSPVASMMPSASPKAMDSTESSTMTGDDATTQVETMELKLDGEAKTIAVEAGSFYFKPAEIRVKKGEVVTIQLTSKDMMHDFNIDALGVKLPITRSGSTNSVTFTADTAGTFEYYCSVGNHRAQGQVGTLIVE